MTTVKISGLTAIALIATLLMAFISTRAQAAGELVTISVSASPATVEVGDTVTVTVTVTSNGAPTGLQAPILYDASKLTFVSRVPTQSCILNSAGQFTVTSAALPADGDSSVICTATFTATAPGAAAITVSEECNASDENFNRTECLANNTSVTVEEVVIPDTSTFSIDDVTVTEGDTAELTITRVINGTGGSVTVTCNPAPGSASGSDFADLNVVATFDSDDVSATCSIPTTDDSSDESTESFTVAISPSVGSVTGGTGTVTITDNDEPVPDSGDIHFATSTSSVNESNTTTQSVVVERTGGDDGAVSVVCEISGGSATFGSDYTATQSQTISWSDGDDSDKVCTYTVVNDSAQESTETIVFVLGNNDGGTLTSPTVHTVSILDNDTPTPTQVTGLTPTATSTSTGGGQATPTKTPFTTSTSVPAATGTSTKTALPTNTSSAQTHTPTRTNTLAPSNTPGGPSNTPGGPANTNTPSGTVGGGSTSVPTTPAGGGTAPLPPSTGSGSSFGGTNAVAALFLVVIGLGVSGFAATRVTRKR